MTAFLLEPVGDGVCSFCKDWAQRLYTVTMPTGHTMCEVGTVDKGTPAQLCRDCLRKMRIALHDEIPPKFRYPPEGS